MVKYYTHEEISRHNHFDDCWVTLADNVLNLTSLLRQYGRGPLSQPILAAAGGSVSHWFKPNTEPPRVKTFVDPVTDLEVPCTPQGRFLHVPPPQPSADEALVALPWWQDPQYIIGRVSSKTMMIRVTNMLTRTEDTLKVCKEESLQDIKERYLTHNRNATSYTWKILRGGELLVLNSHLTLEENGILDESDTYLALGLDEEEYLPNLLIYFDDDLHDA